MTIHLGHLGIHAFLCKVGSGSGGTVTRVRVSYAGAYELEPKASDHTHQQLSFKYEPPSPKFGRKHPGCLSYRCGWGPDASCVLPAALCGVTVANVGRLGIPLKESGWGACGWGA